MTKRTMPARSLTAMALTAWRDPLARRAVWLTVPFGVQQVLRLFTSIILARLLAPEMFGVMVLINTLRTGTELLSDLGIGQSVVRSPHAGDQTFLDTAWSVQVLRGALLTLVALLAAYPIAQAFHNPALAPIIALVSSTFLMAGMQSPEIFLIQRDMRVVERGIYDVACTVGIGVITIALAYLWGNVWALVWGLVLGQLFTTAMTYVFAPFRIPRLTWHKEYTAEIFHFGKWVFLSTAIYFAAISTDKFYFSAALPLAMVGIYGVGRTFSEMLNALAQRLGGFLVFPKVVELRHSGVDLAGGFQRKRRMAVGLLAAGLTVALAISDQIILMLYDSRYHAAAFMLPILFAGGWFAALAAFGESTLFGLDRPRETAVGNFVKFAILVIGLPLMVPLYGIFAGLLVLMFAEFGRWAALSFMLRSERLASVRDDVLMTIGIGVAAVALKVALGALGLVPTFQQWWALGNLVHG